MSTKREQIKEVILGAPSEIQVILTEVLRLENEHLHEIKPHLIDEIERIVISSIK